MLVTLEKVPQFEEMSGAGREGEPALTGGPILLHSPKEPVRIRSAPLTPRCVLVSGDLV